jgi:hypothetical protein
MPLDRPSMRSLGGLTHEYQLADRVPFASRADGPARLTPKRVSSCRLRPVLNAPDCSITTDGQT